MQNTWLVLDCNFLCYRAYFSIGNLEYDGIATTVFFGFFKELVQLQELHGTDKFCFCFDYGRPRRIDICATYKSSRRKDDLDEDEVARKTKLRRQMKVLRTKVLKCIGYRNVFAQEGYEADDLIASLCNTLPKDDRIIIVGTDSDLWQLLSKRVSIWNTQKKELLTKEKFIREWRIDPLQWADVKSIAGCSTDDVPGVDGVGEKTAVKFLRGELKPGTKKYESIVMENTRWEKNDALVRLPYKGTMNCVVLPDQVTEENWDRAMRKLGMVSLVKGRKKRYERM